jgi:hypothetical protein
MYHQELSPESYEVFNYCFIVFRREVERTRGVSTTDMVGRMLLMTKGHFMRGPSEYEVGRGHSSRLGMDHSAQSPFTACSQFLPTSRKIIQFSEGKEPKVGLRQYLILQRVFSSLS